MSGQVVAPQTRELETFARQMAQWLAKQMPQSGDLRLTNMRYPMGAGTSHETILLDASWSNGGRREEQGLVVRIKPEAHALFPDDLFVEQFQVMKVLHDKGVVPVAEPLWLETDPSLLGAPFFVMTQVTGRVPVSYPPYATEGWVADATPDQRRTMWANGVRALATIHGTPPADLGFLADADGLTGLEQEWQRYIRFIEWVSKDRRWPILEAAMDNLRARWPDNRPAGLLWGDARFGNIMFDEEMNVVAVMDWEQASLGGPLNDLAWWLTFDRRLHGAAPGREALAGMGSREETIALWQDLTGLSAADIDWYEDFAQLKVECVSISSAIDRKEPMPDLKEIVDRLGL